MAADDRAAGPLNVLFLCAGNAGRSILAEAILNRLGAPRFRAFSAGARPKTEVNPHAIALLQGLGYETDGLRSKGWDAFAASDAPRLDLVITVCDHVAAEPCPVWPGRPATAHWSVPDPTAAEPSQVAQAVADAYDLLLARVTALCADAGPQSPIS